MAHPIKMITYQDLHKLNHSIQQLSDWHEKFKVLKNNSDFSDDFLNQHAKILNSLNTEIQKLKRKRKLKEIMI